MSTANESNVIRGEGMVLDVTNDLTYGEVMPGWEVSLGRQLDTIQRSDSGGDVHLLNRWQVSGTVTIRELTSALFAAITGATETSSASYKAIKGEAQTVPATPYTVTLDNGGANETIVGVSKVWNKTLSKYLMEAAAAASGVSYSRVDDALTFHADEEADVLEIDYVYSTDTAGTKVSLKQNSSPSDIELILVWERLDWRLKSESDSLIARVKNVQFTGDLKLGGAQGSIHEVALSFVGSIEADDDFELHFG